MAGITLLISTLVGKLAGVIPDFFSEWKAGREHKRELELMEQQTELQIRLADKKIEQRTAELDAEMLMAGMQAESQMLENQAALAVEQLKTKTGIKWIDGLNALLRPLFTLAIMALFVVTSGMFVYDVIVNSDLPMQAKATIIWGSLVGQSIEAVIGFLYGYRSTNKKAVK